MFIQKKKRLSHVTLDFKWAQSKVSGVNVPIQNKIYDKCNLKSTNYNFNAKETY